MKCQEDEMSDKQIDAGRFYGNACSLEVMDTKSFRYTVKIEKICLEKLGTISENSSTPIACQSRMAFRLACLIIARKSCSNTMPLHTRHECPNDETSKLDMSITI